MCGILVRKKLMTARRKSIGTTSTLQITENDSVETVLHERVVVTKHSYTIALPVVESSIRWQKSELEQIQI